MKAFKVGQKIVVTDTRSPIVGKTGIVQLIRYTGGAIVWMDEVLPENLQRQFMSHDERRNNIVLYPEECGERS